MTIFFVIILYMYSEENAGIDFSTEEIIFLGVAYIIGLIVFMDKKVSSPKGINDKTGDKVYIKQNNIGLFNVLKNTKK